LNGEKYHYDCPLSYKNGLWRFKDRLKSWQELGSRLFDGHLDTFKDTVLEVLQVDDPSFELPSEITLNNGIKQADGSYLLSQNDLSNLQLIIGSFSGHLNIEIEATSIELSNSDTVTSSKTLSVDVIQTGDANDNQLMGDDADNIIRGLAGDDTITGNQGDDALSGGLGSVILT
jgi:Ca2+-binding RTX toxin-like protein